MINIPALWWHVIATHRHCDESSSLKDDPDSLALRATQVFVYRRCSDITNPNILSNWGFLKKCTIITNSNILSIRVESAHSGPSLPPKPLSCATNSCRSSRASHRFACPSPLNLLSTVALSRYCLSLSLPSLNARSLSQLFFLSLNSLPP